MAEQKTCIRLHAFSAWCEWLSHTSMQASGRVAATGQCGRNADVVIWDVATGAIRARFQEHDIEVVQLTFSLDDRLLLSVGQERWAHDTPMSAFPRLAAISSVPCRIAGSDGSHVVMPGTPRYSCSTLPRGRL